MAQPPPYPHCPVRHKDEPPGFAHDGGAQAGGGPLYYPAPGNANRIGHAFACAACFALLKKARGPQVAWPPPPQTWPGATNPLGASRR